MALSKLFDEILLENSLNELFDFENIDPFEYDNVGNDQFKFKISDKMTCNVKMEDVSQHLQNVKFPPILQTVAELVNASFDINGVDTQYAKEDIKLYTKIMLTVKDCVSEYILKNNPQCVAMVPMSKTGAIKSDRQKDAIYRYIWKIYPVVGYGIADIKVNSYDAFCLYNIAKTRSVK